MEVYSKSSYILTKLKKNFYTKHSTAVNQLFEISLKNDSQRFYLGIIPSGTQKKGAFLKYDVLIWQWPFLTRCSTTQ